MPVDSIPPTAADGGAVILAAGFGRRFGSDKRRHLLADGTPMLLATLARYAAVFEHIVVVLREEDESLATQVHSLLPDADVVHAALAHLGMGHSLVAGISSVAGRWQYAVIGLADMPYVEPATLALLRDTYLAGRHDAIVQPICNGQPGNPVVFGSCYFDEIEALQGDEGARALLGRHADRLRRVSTSDRGVIKDIDRPPET